MRAAGEAATKRDATRLRLKCQQLITQAERLKAAISGHQPTQPPSLLQRTSRLHGNYFPPWSAEPTEKDFSLPSGDEPFT